LEIALFDYALCALVQREVEQSIATLLSTTTLSLGSEESAVGSHRSPSPKRWISLALVHHWPRFLESRWVEASVRRWASSHSTIDDRRWRSGRREGNMFVVGVVEGVARTRIV
jgi:hypothetical protein